MMKAARRNVSQTTCSKTLRCSVCGNTFSYSRNLLRHTRTFHSSTLDEYVSCNFCDKKCYGEENLKKHQNVCLKNGLKSEFQCSICEKKFMYGRNLRRHKRDKHGQQFPDSTETVLCRFCGRKCIGKIDLMKHEGVCLTKGDKNEFECLICGRIFLYSRNLRRHTRTIHALQLPRLDEDVTIFVCNGCGKKFSRKDNLKIHIMKCQNRVLEQDTFICETCGKKYPKKISLKWHIQRKHLLEKVTRCDNCNVSFKGHSSINDLAEHTEVCQLKNTNGRINCALCGASFSTKKSILRHIAGEKHRVVMHHEHLHFSSQEDFEAWKVNVEKKTTTFFRKDGTKHFHQNSVSRFVCHRSGTYRPKISDRKRRIKLQGTKKIGGFCPAEIVLDKRKEDGLCRVSYVTTHVGHNVCDESELAHVYLRKNERIQIASKLSKGVPYSEILTDFAKSCHAMSLIDPSYLLTKKDLNNISRDYNVKETKISCNFEDDETADVKCSPELTNMSLEAFLNIYQNSVLFVKKPGEVCENTFCLRKDDLFIVIMTDKQKQILTKYGHKVVLADGTFDIPDNDFLFLTLLVIDDYDEGIPVAFAVSNNLEEKYIDTFFTCVRNNLGPLHPQMLMSCSQPDIVSRWEKIMGPTQYRSFCKWHANDLWQSHLKMIVNLEKRKEIRNKLREISTNLDIEMFQSDLEDLLGNSDPELEQFILSFRATFCHNVENWAYCYRQVSGVCTNIYTESFNRMLKHFYSKFKKMKSLMACLALISNYLNTRERDVKKKEIRGKLCHKLTELRRRHDEFVKENFTVSVECTPDFGWYVSVSYKDSDVESIHLIRECEDICHGCKVYCEKCDACVHQYQCTCTDNTIKNNMCIHIHALCTYLKIEKNDIKEETILIIDNEGIYDDSQEDSKFGIAEDISDVFDVRSANDRQFSTISNYHDTGTLTK